MKNKIINYIPGKHLQIIEDVFTKEECDKMIEASEKNKYTQAGLYTDGYGNEHFFLDKRKSERSIIDNQDFSKFLYRKIFKYLPKKYNNIKIHSINNRFRFLKYNIGDYFIRHRDTNYQSPDGSISLITILIYLNENYEGAYTTFFSDPDDFSGYILKPKIGMVCLMDQSIGHEVNSLINGTKYVVRTEIMYK